MNGKVIGMAMALFALALVGGATAQGPPDNGLGATQVFGPALWNDGELYGTVVTPKDVSANAPAHSFDVLYNFGDSGLEGQRSTIEAAPGDRDFNGGRWAVHPVTFTESGLAEFDQDGDGTIDTEFTSNEEVEQAEADGYVEISDEAARYFVCTVKKLH